MIPYVLHTRARAHTHTLTRTHHTVHTHTHTALCVEVGYKREREGYMWERATSGGVMVAGVVAAGLQAGTRGLHVGTGGAWRAWWRPGYKREREGYMWERATSGGRLQE